MFDTIQKSQINQNPHLWIQKEKKIFFEGEIAKTIFFLKK